MPFTLSHPAAVLPLFPWARDPIFLVSLVIGSLSPDFGYYTRMFGVATAAHSLVGSVLICMPSGLFALAVILVFRKPLLFLMPSRFRDVISKLLTIPERRPVVLFLQICFWIWLGACTHILWDAFTHKTGWFVERSGFLQGTLLSFGGTAFPTYYLLQQISTVTGLTVVLVFIFLRFRRGSPPPSRRLADIRRYIFWSALILVSILGVLPIAWRFAAQYEGLLRVRSLIFQVGVMSGSVFMILVIISLLVAAWMLRKNNE